MYLICCGWLLFTLISIYIYIFVCMLCLVAAALALMDQPHLSAEDVVRKAMKIAGDICVYTNHNVTCELLPKPEGAETVPAGACSAAVADSLNSSPSSGAEAVEASGGAETPFKANVAPSTLAGLKFY